MRKKLFSIVICCVLLLTLNSYAGQEKEADSVPDTEKRSCIQAVDGYAYLSEDMTLKDTRAAAFATAKRQALEMAKTYIQSKTKVENYEVKYDMIWSEAEGAVTILEQKDHGVEDNTRYHVWIKAEVEYDLKPKKQEKEKAKFMDPYAPLTVRVWTKKKAYQDGEKIVIFLQGNRDFYARIVDITSSGDIIQLLPNEFSTGSLFEEGRVYQIPGRKDRFELKVTPPYGEDKIIVYASEAPLGAVDTTPIGQGLSMYRGTQESLGMKTRGIAVTAAKKDETAGLEFYEAAWAITTGK